MKRQCKYYEISGHKYKFEILYIDGGIPYGRCARLHKHGWLYDRYIQFKDGEIVPATPIL